MTLSFRHIRVSQGRDPGGRVRWPLPGRVVSVRLSLHDRCVVLRRVGYLHPQVRLGLRLHRGGVRTAARVPLPLGRKYHLRVREKIIMQKVDGAESCI